MRDRPVKQRPIKRDYPKKENRYRIPEDGLLTPRLRDKPKDISLVGFHHDFVGDSDED